MSPARSPTPARSVWLVNGVQGTNNGDGTWSAQNVPNAPVGGVATFDLTAQSSLLQMDALTGFYFSSDASSQNPLVNNTNNYKPPQIVVTDYFVRSTNIYTPTVSGNSNAHPYVALAPAPYTNTCYLHWAEDGGTTGFGTFASTNSSCTTNFNWPPDEYILGVSSPSQNGTNTCTCSTNQTMVGPPNVLLESCSYATTYTNYGETIQASRTAQTTLTLLTGGYGRSHGYRLYDISGSVMAVTNVITGAGCPVPPTQIAMGELGNLGADSNLWRTLQDNATKDITPKVSGLNPNYYTFTAPTKTIYTLTHQTLYPAYSDTNLARLNLGVGEYVTFSGMPAGTQWTNTGGGLSTNIGAGVTFTAPSNAVTSVTVTARYHGQGLQSTFNVAEPSFHGTASILTTISLPVDTIGAGMIIELNFNPQNVSFYRVFTWELPVGIDKITGYFTNNASSIPTNINIGHAQLPGETNQSFQDTVVGNMSDFFSYSLPLYQGSWNYLITNMWTIPGSNITNYWGTAISTNTMLDSAGDFSVTKWGKTVTRSMNDVYY